MLNYFRDTNLQALSQLTSQFLDGRPPQFLKEAAIEQDQEVSTLADSVFAAPSDRLLPCHTKSAAYLASLYFYGARANGCEFTGYTPVDVVERRLEKAARLHGITADVMAFRKKASYKPEPPKQDFAFVRDGDGAEIIYRFPISDSAQVKSSASSLIAERGNFPYAWRREAAINLLTKAAELSVTLPSAEKATLVKMAGMFPRTGKALERAASLITRYTRRQAQNETRDVLEKAASFVPPEREKVAQFCEDVEAFFLDNRCQGQLQRGELPYPEELLFTAPAAVKSASVTLTNGAELDMTDLMQRGLPAFKALPAVYSDALGASPTLEKVADILRTMPADNASLFEKALAATGITPLQPGGDSSLDLFETLLRA